MRYDANGAYDVLAQHDTPQAVGRAAGKLLDDDSSNAFTAGAIREAKERRLEELRMDRGTTRSTSSADRIDDWARRNRIRMR